MVKFSVYLNRHVFVMTLDISEDILIMYNRNTKQEEVHVIENLLLLITVMLSGMHQQTYLMQIPPFLYP